MIFDCFPFNNEFEVLEIRLNQLNKTVDKFVISESNLTHSGTPKPFYLKEKLNTVSFLDDFKKKIIRIEADLTSFTKPWDRENHQRNALMGVLDIVHDDDTVLLSDADEIPSNYFINSRRFIESEKVPYLLSKQYFYYYNFNYRKKEECHGTISFLKKSLRHNFQALRDSRFTLPFLQGAGWHLSFFGSPEQVKSKIESFAHTEFGNKNNIEEIKNNILEGKDIFGRNTPQEELIKELNLNKIPDYVRENPVKFSHLL